jgi:hypothetical protein
MWPNPARPDSEIGVVLSDVNDPSSSGTEES